MPIELPAETIQRQKIRATVRFQSDPWTADGERKTNPSTQFYRGTIELVGNDRRMTMDAMPIEVHATDMEDLTEFAEIPAQLQGVITSQAQLTQLFKLTPALISMIGDAAERKKIADDEAARMAQAAEQGTL